MTTYCSESNRMPRLDGAVKSCPSASEEVSDIRDWFS